MNKKSRKVTAAVCAVMMAASCFSSVGAAAVDEFFGGIASAEPVYAAAAGDVAINETNFPDNTFRQYVSTFDKDENGILSQAELNAVTNINVSGTNDKPNNIADLTGIEHFSKLQMLCCSNNELTSLDVSNNPDLNYLECYRNQLTDINVENTVLECLYCDDNQITDLDISSIPELEFLTLNHNKLTSLDVSKNTALKTIHCYDNMLTNLDLSNNTALEYLNCNKNQLTSLDLSQNKALNKLYCNSNQLSSLDLRSNTALIELTCDTNPLISLDVSNCTALETLIVFFTKLRTLDVSNNKALKMLDCGDNRLTSLDISNNTALTEFGCTNNKYPIGNIPSSYSLSRLPKGFDPAKASNWTGVIYDEATNTINLMMESGTYVVYEEMTYDYDCGNGKTVTFTLTISTPEPYPDDPIAAFVERLYENILNRHSDPSMITHFSNLYNGESACKVAYDFVFSSEFANLPISNEERVKRMYLTFLNREADPAGLATWVETLDNGCSIGHIFYGFTQSNEFTEICEQYGITRGTWEYTENRDRSSKLTAFVSRLYTKAMGRDFDVNGLNDHTGSYLENHDLYQLACNFIFSQEFIDKNLTNEEFVDVMYRTFFDREADPAGKADWLGRMANGATREDVLAGFVGSQECINLVAKFGI